MKERVFLNYTQQELDDAYDQSVYAQNREQLLARLPTSSERLPKRLGPPLRFGYGPTEIEKLDVYATQTRNAPINVFIHGGAWRTGLAKNYDYAAEMFVQAGAHDVALGFGYVEQAGGS